MTQTPSNDVRPTLLEVRRLSKRYGDVRAVDDVSLEVRQGELVSFLGPSGSGKTTTLNMIAGFDEPTEGDILIGGRAIQGVSPHKRDIGMVFQRYTLFPHLTVFENVAFPLTVRGVGKAEIAEKVRAALKLIRLESYDNRRPSQLSGGQQQRVALARAFIYEPQLLLMDEPLGALDKKLREEIQIEIRRIHERLGVTIVYVTHDQEEALRLSDRIAVFNHGRIVQVGTGIELYEHPDSAFVASFVGNSNFLSGRVATIDGPSCSVTLSGGGSIAAPAQPDLPVGSAVSLMFRPERAVLRRVGEAQADENRIGGRVLETVYLGESVNHTLMTADGIEISIKQSSGNGHGLGQGVGQGLGQGLGLDFSGEAEVCWRRDQTHLFAA
jgi:putative spermidine/putrescine transport system ATP-binding protein